MCRMYDGNEFLSPTMQHDFPISRLSDAPYVFWHSGALIKYIEDAPRTSTGREIVTSSNPVDDTTTSSYLLGTNGADPYRASRHLTRLAHTDHGDNNAESHVTRSDVTCLGYCLPSFSTTADLIGPRTPLRHV
jgi:hypothetical protein